LTFVPKKKGGDYEDIFTIAFNNTNFLSNLCSFFGNYEKN